MKWKIVVQKQKDEFYAMREFKDLMVEKFLGNKENLYFLIHFVYNVAINHFAFRAWRAPHKEINRTIIVSKF